MPSRPAKSLFGSATKYTNVNALTQLVVKEMPFPGTWFYVKEGLISEIMFPDFSVSTDTANKVATLTNGKLDSTQAKTNDSTTPTKDSYYSIPSGLEDIFRKAAPPVLLDSGIQYIDIPGSKYDGLPIKQYTLDINIGQFVKVNDSFYHVPNAKSTAERVTSDININQYVKPQFNTLLEPFFESDLKLLDVLSDNTGTNGTVKANNSGLQLSGSAEPYKGSKSLLRGNDIYTYTYSVKVPAFTPLDTNGTALSGNGAPTFTPPSTSNTTTTLASPTLQSNNVLTIPVLSGVLDTTVAKDEIISYFKIYESEVSNGVVPDPTKDITGAIKSASITKAGVQLTLDQTKFASVADQSDMAVVYTKPSTDTDNALKSANDKTNLSSDFTGTFTYNTPSSDPPSSGMDGNHYFIYRNRTTDSSSLGIGGNYKITTNDNEPSDGFPVQLGYKQSYDLVDYYVAYTDTPSTELVYDAIQYGSTAANGLTFNPIEERAQQEPTDPNLATAIVVQTGLQDLVLRAYGSIAYQLSAADQAEIENAGESLNADLSSLAELIQESYLSNPAFKDDPLFAQSSDADDQFNYRSVANTLYQMATIIYFNYAQLVNPETSTFKSIDKHYTAAAAQLTEAEQNKAHTLAIGDFYGQLASGKFDWQNTIYSRFGTIDPITQIPQYSLPWDASFYQQYKEIRLKGNYDTFFLKTDVATYFEGNLQNAVRYLIDLGSLNSGDSYTVNTPDNFVKLVGDDATYSYGPKVQTFPRPKKPEKTSIEIEMETSNVAGKSNIKASSLSASYSADVSYKGWFASASVDSQGKYSTSKSSMSAANNSASTKIHLKYDDMGTQPVRPHDSWFQPEILEEAWNQTTTRNNPHSTTHAYKGGFGFYSPDDQHKFITADLYYISNFAFGDQNLSIDVQTESSTTKATERYKSFGQSTTVAGGVHFGPFHANASSTISNSNVQRNQAFNAASTAQGMHIHAAPLKAYQSDEIKTFNGNPKYLVAVEVDKITSKGSITAVDPISASNPSSRLLPTLVSSAASFRRSKGGSKNSKNGKNNSKNGTIPSDKGQFTMSNVDTLDPKGTNKHHLKGGHDYHLGSKYTDLIIGGGGDDVLVGYLGNDVLKGSTGSDVLYGGSGKNKLYGGRGKDYFIIERHNKSDGSIDKIIDASLDDILVFSGYHSDDINIKKGNQIWADGYYVAQLVGGSKELTNTLVGQAIHN